MRILIEPAHPEDTPAILQLLAENDLPLEGAAECAETALVARADGRLVGSAMLEVYPDGALLRSVAVHASVRNRRVGHRLTEAASNLAGTRALPAMYLLTTTAEKFFRRLGFDKIERTDVPAGVQGSVEFRSACPATATVMRKIMRRLTTD